MNSKNSVLPITPINPDSPVPLYHQVEMDLRSLIQAGVLAPHDLLPPETELSKLYGVGRQTIRMALSRLVNSHIISRQAGRGTFILPQPDRVSFFLDRSFTRQMADQGMTPSSRVLYAAFGVVSASASRALRDHLGAPCFYLTRLRSANDEPVGVQYATVLTARCPTIDQHDFAYESLYDVLARQYQLPITRITNTVTAAHADATQAELLELATDDILLQVNTAAYLETGEVIEVNTSYYRTDKYEFSITHTL